MHHALGESRRRGHQDRAPLGGPGPDGSRGDGPGGEHLLLCSQSQQERYGYQSQEPRGARDLQGAREELRGRYPELPPRHHGEDRTGIRCAQGDQPRDHLRRPLRVRPDRAVQVAALLRPHRRGDEWPPLPDGGVGRSRGAAPRHGGGLRGSGAGVVGGVEHHRGDTLPGQDREGPDDRRGSGGLHGLPQPSLHHQLQHAGHEHAGVPGEVPCLPGGNRRHRQDQGRLGLHSGFQAPGHREDEADAGTGGGGQRHREGASHRHDERRGDRLHARFRGAHRGDLLGEGAGERSPPHREGHVHRGGAPESRDHQGPELPGQVLRDPR